MEILHLTFTPISKQSKLLIRVKIVCAISIAAYARLELLSIGFTGTSAFIVCAPRDAGSLSMTDVFSYADIQQVHVTVRIGLRIQSVGQNGCNRLRIEPVSTLRACQHPLASTLARTRLIAASPAANTIYW